MPMEKLQQRMRRVGQGRGISSVPFSSEREKVRTRKDAVERERERRALAITLVVRGARDV